MMSVLGFVETSLRLIYLAHEYTALWWMRVGCSDYIFPSRITLFIAPLTL